MYEWRNKHDMEQTSVSASAFFFFDRCELNNTEQALEVPVSVYGKGGEANQRVYTGTHL